MAECVRKLIGLGHNPHCAKRIVWGDGECECGTQRRAREQARLARVLRPFMAVDPDGAGP